MTLPALLEKLAEGLKPESAAEAKRHIRGMGDIPWAAETADTKTQEALERWYDKHARHLVALFSPVLRGDKSYAPGALYDFFRSALQTYALCRAGEWYRQGYPVFAEDVMVAFGVTPEMLSRETTPYSLKMLWEYYAAHAEGYAASAAGRLSFFPADARRVIRMVIRLEYALLRRVRESRHSVFCTSVRPDRDMFRWIWLTRYYPG